TIMAGTALALALLTMNAIISYRSTRTLIFHERWVSHTHKTLTELEATLSTMTDAETGERRVILTREEPYPEAYPHPRAQIGDRIRELKRLTADNPAQLARVSVLERQVEGRLELLKRAIERRRSGDFDGARQVTQSGAGKRLMDELRQHIDVMES